MEKREDNHGSGKGTLYVIGIGPGSKKHLTSMGRDVLSRCSVIVGYKTYIDLINHLLEGKVVITTGMTGEVERCRKAIAHACSGCDVALISSGDSGIYGMAGLVLELLRDDSELNVEIVPGVPAFCSASAILGAPLMHDFASISLSDILTPWGLIKKRVRASAEADFVIIFYNPKSRKRKDQLEQALNIVSEFRDSTTPVGIVKKATREGEETHITTLKQISEHYDLIDMTTIIIVGNSSTFLSRNKRMVTPRGYIMHRKKSN